MKINIEEIEVGVRLTGHLGSAEKAIVTLSVGPLKIKGFRIRESDYPNKYGEKIWIAPPSYISSESGKWHRMFHCEDKELWKEIEDKIYEEYKRKNEEIPIIEEDGDGKGGYTTRNETIKKNLM